MFYNVEDLTKFIYPYYGYELLAAASIGAAIYYYYNRKSRLQIEKKLLTDIIFSSIDSNIISRVGRCRRELNCLLNLVSSVNNPLKEYTLFHMMDKEYAIKSIDASILQLREYIKDLRQFLTQQNIPCSLPTFHKIKLLQCLDYTDEKIVKLEHLSKSSSPIRSCIDTKDTQEFKQLLREWREYVKPYNMILNES